MTKCENQCFLPAQRDELREIFNDISSSSDDEEDEGDLRHEDEDLNIMDMEEDLVRQLQDKLNESSDGARDEADRNNQIGEAGGRRGVGGKRKKGNGEWASPGRLEGVEDCSHRY